MTDVELTPLFKKLNLGAHREIVILNAPDTFESELKQLKGVKVARDPSTPKAVKFALAFATTQAQLDRSSKTLAAAAEGDAVLWFVYPKGDRKSTRLNSSHSQISYAVFCLKKKKNIIRRKCSFVV